MKKALILLAVVAGLSACKKEVTKLVDQDKIWTHFELFYDENVDVTYAYATFRFSTEIGTKLMLSDPSTVSADGATMEWNADDAKYETQFTGIRTTADFNWIDLDGNSFTNSIGIRDVSYPAVLPVLSHDDSVNYFMWEGAPLDTNESMRLHIDGVGESDTRIFSIDTLNATTITLDSLKLAQVDSGMVTLHLDKEYTPEMQEQTSKGGLLLGRYRATDHSVLLD